ncbi:hypothetical protein [Prochlorococcus marinus]|uniref:hypothetical protein n=1 Tax=Prochlorococcus marinus TaxID=1219 RepID=UPI0013911F15|nr:hypothetical protein [Prochlorococcus marinus]
MALKPSRFIVFHTYISFIYLVMYVAKTSSFDGYGLLFTSLVLAPLFLAIYGGLPVDCLNYQTAISRELEVIDN